MSTVEILIEDNIGLVYDRLVHYRMLDDPDAESFAYEALYLAAKSFEPTKGIKFSTFACVCINNKLCGYIRHLKRKRQLEILSYNDVCATTDSGETTEWLDRLSSDVSLEDTVVRKEFSQEVAKAMLAEYNEATNEVYRKVLKVWIESNLTISTKQASELAGVSQSHASHLISVAKGRLRKRLENYNADAFY